MSTPPILSQYFQSNPQKYMLQKPPKQPLTFLFFKLLSYHIYIQSLPSNLFFGQIPYKAPSPMPGAIHVSVRDHKDLQSSSLPSSILVKVSMGKREYQTWDKGDFSFPLTTLRDNLSITLEDTEGNEISRRGVQSLSVLEKGSWDEFLPLEGGGHVHMKLQFVLSEEERNRIRIMRESAMKKKSDELLKCLETASTAGGVVMSSSSINHEVSGLLLDVLSAASSQDSQRSVTHNEAASIGDPAIHADTLSNLECAAGNEEEIAFHQKQITPNDTDGSEETLSAASMSKRMNVHLGGVTHGKSVEKTKTKLHHDDVPKIPLFLQEDSSNTKKNLVASELKNDQADQPEKQDPLKKMPSNVRKMISAFESSLAKAYLLEDPKDLSSKEMTKQAKLGSGRLKNPFLTELQQIQTSEIKREEHIGFDQDLNGRKSSKGTIKIQVKETESIAEYELRKRQEDLVRMSAVEAATIWGSMREEHSKLHQPHNLLVNQKDSCGTAFMDGRGTGIRSNDTNIHGPSVDKLNSAAFCENEHSFSENSTAWIFPDHTRYLCITTASKRVMDLVGGYGIQEWTHKGNKSISLPENVEKCSMQFGNYTEVKKGDKTSHEPRKSRLESSAEVETSTGPVGQAVKIAIMVAFGTLVLLTRQRKPR